MAANEIERLIRQPFRCRVEIRTFGRWDHYAARVVSATFAGCRGSSSTNASTPPWRAWAENCMRCSLRLQCRQETNDERCKRPHRRDRKGQRSRVFMKGSRSSAVRFSSRAITILEHLGVPRERRRASGRSRQVSRIFGLATIPSYTSSEFVGDPTSCWNVRKRRGAATRGAGATSLDNKKGR